MTKTGRHNVLRSLEPVTKLMGLLGIPIPASMEVSSCRLTCHLYSTFCFLTVMSIQSIQVIHIIYNAKDVSMGYCLSGLSSSSSALSWNLIIESLNLALYAVDSHICLLLLTLLMRSKTWTDLINSFKLLDDNLPKHNIFVILLQLKAIHQLIEDKLIKRKVSSLTSVESQRSQPSSQLTVLRRHHRLICKAILKINPN
uniref:Uncharacterized protein n=1 Tax=Daphnia galeata TaxID=27404 RepID=A0A8J2WDQ1_9CRUS|nr:unnamed protein product [Daphnia galeata]